MGKGKVKIKFNKNMDKLMKGPIAFVEQFPCPKCKTTSKKVGGREFYCPKCELNFNLDVEYTK